MYHKLLSNRKLPGNNLDVSSIETVAPNILHSNGTDSREVYILYQSDSQSRMTWKISFVCCKFSIQLKSENYWYPDI